MIDPSTEFPFATVTSSTDNRPDPRVLTWLSIKRWLARSSERTEKDGPAFMPVYLQEAEYENRQTGEAYRAIRRNQKSIVSVGLAVASVVPS